MIINFEEYKLRRAERKMKELAESTKSGGYAIAEACFSLAYRAREIAAQIENNERNNDRFKNPMK